MDSKTLLFLGQMNITDKDILYLKNVCGLLLLIDRAKAKLNRRLIYMIVCVMKLRFYKVYYESLKRELKTKTIYEIDI